MYNKSIEIPSASLSLPDEACFEREDEAETWRLQSSIVSTFTNVRNSLQPSRTLPGFKRSVGCQQLNATTYMTQDNYTTEFSSCMDGCVTWNTNMSQKCLGVTWVYDQYGPHGPSAGGQCYFYWGLEDASEVSDQDSGQLILSATPTTSPLVIAGLEDPVCLPHNQTVYTSPIGAQFFIFCEGVFPVTVDDAQFGDLYFTIVPDFLTCVNGCAEWNQNTSLPQCLGISFALGVYGPEGEGKGSWCMYRWNIGEGNFVYTQGWSVARLQTYSNISSTRTSIVSTPTLSNTGTGATVSTITSNQGSAIHVGGLVGGLVGGVLASILLAILVLCRLRKRSPTPLPQYGTESGSRYTDGEHVYMDQLGARLETRYEEDPGGRLGRWEGEFPGGRLDRELAVSNL